MHVLGHVGHVVAGVCAGTPQGCRPGAHVARLGGRGAVSRAVQRGGGTVAGVLHHVSRWRLAGLCCQYDGSAAGFAGGAVCADAEKRVGMDTRTTRNKRIITDFILGSYILSYTTGSI